MSCVARRDGDRYLLDGVKDYVFDGLRADVVVVAAKAEDGPGLFAVRAGDAVRTGHPTLDQTRPQARFTFAAAPAVRVGGTDETGRALDLLWAAIAIESVGVARASLAMTVGHLKARQQFGVPLATFQALRHRVADLAVAIEAATSSAWYAIRVAGTDEFAVVAPMAKLVATDAAYQVTAQGIQLHGGIGITWEHDAHRYFKRATANRLLLGDPVALRRIVGTRAQVVEGLVTSE
jgi:alkylation response protein AidB-like acyl-CoA dehydrogenase